MMPAHKQQMIMSEIGQKTWYEESWK